MAYYVLTVSMPGYMPESDPYVIETDDTLPALPEVLRTVREEVERMGDAYASGEDAAADLAWARLSAEMARDQDRAADLDESGVSYRMPDGYVIDATRRTRAELVELGYKPGEDFATSE